MDLRVIAALLVCVFATDASGVVRKVNLNQIAWSQFHLGYIPPSPNQEIWQYSFSFRVSGKTSELKTNIYFVVNPSLINRHNPNAMQGWRGSRDYINRQNAVYDEIMNTDTGFKMLRPYFEDFAVDQNLPAMRNHFVVTNFEASSMESALKYWAANHHLASNRQYFQALLNQIKNDTGLNALALSSNDAGYRKTLQIGEGNRQFQQGASASIAVRGTYSTLITDIRYIAEEHSHAYDIVHGRLAVNPASINERPWLTDFRFASMLELDELVSEGEAAGWLPRADNFDIHNRVMLGEINHHKVMEEIKAIWLSQERTISAYPSADGYGGYKAAYLLENIKLHHPADTTVTIALPQWGDFDEFEAFVRRGGGLNERQYRRLYSELDDISLYFKYALEHHGNLLNQHGLANIARAYRENSRATKVSLWRLFHHDFPNTRLLEFTPRGC